MAFIFTGDDRQHEIDDEAYRSYLITRSPLVIVHHSLRMQWMRLNVHIRGMLRWMTRLWTSINNLAGKKHAYDPERYYMRGPGPKWRQKHEANKEEGDGIYIPQNLDGKWDY